MRDDKLGWAVVIAALALGGVFEMTVSPVGAVQWTGGAADDYWASGGNWDSGLAPIDGEEARFNMGGAINVDLNGTPVDLPASTLFIRNVAPLIIEDLANPADPVSITVDVFHIQQFSRPRSQIRVPIVAKTEIRSRYRLGGVEFYEPLETPEVDLGRGNIYLFGDVDATTEFKVVKNDAGTIAYLRIHPDTSVLPTLTTPTVLVDDQTSTFYAGGVVDADTVTITNGGRYFAEVDGALGEAATEVTLSNGGFLQIDAPQTSLASIDVGPFSVLAGDLTGATFGGGGSVVLVEDTVLAPAVDSPVPTRADLGGDAILYQGATTSNKTLVVGDNETDAIYKGAAVGAFYGTGNMNGVSITAAADSGNLMVVYAGAGCPNTSNNRLFGDGTSTSADISVLNGGLLRLTGAFNWDYDHVFGGEPTRIDTFNISGEVGKEAVGIMDHYRTARTHILEGQTWNISHGKWTLRDHFAGKGQHGDVTLTDGVLAWPATDFNAIEDEGFTLTLAGRTVVETHTASQHGFLEELGDNFSYSGMPVVTLTDKQNYAIDYDTGPTGTNPVMADLMLHADVSSATYKAIDFAGDLLIGHGQYLYNALYRQDDHAGPTSAVGKIRPGGNQPDGEPPIIGFAGTALGGGKHIDVDMEVDAAGGIVRCGTTDPDRIMVANSGGFVTAIPTGTVIFHKPVTADELQIRSGTARFIQDLEIPRIDLETDTTLRMDGGATATVSDTLSGNGTVIGGNGIVVEDGGTFAWAVSDPDGEAGTGWDVLWTTSLIDFDLDNTGTVNFAPIDAGIPLGMSIEIADEFVVAAHDNGVIDMPGTWAFAATPGWGLDSADLSFVEDYADVDGDTDPDDCLVLSGVSFWPAAPMTWTGGAGDWALAGNWDPEGPPLANSQVTVADAGDYATIDAPAAAASLDVVEGTVDVQSTLAVGQTVTVGPAGTLIVDGELTAADAVCEGTLVVGGTFTADDVICNGTLGGNGTINGGLIATGVVAPGPGAATLTIDGSGELSETTEYVCEIVGLANDRLVFGGQDAFLGGTLTLVPRSVDASEIGTTVTRTIVSALGEAAIMEPFAAVPPSPDFDAVPPDSPSVGYLGLGVFHRGVTYVEAVGGAVTGVDVDLHVAVGGDSNADGNVDGQDIQTLIINFNMPGDPADRNWLQSDTAGGSVGRGDGNVDGQDITDLITHFTGDAGPVTDGTASAEYNPATGEFRVLVDGVMNWSLISDGLFTDAGLAAASDVLPLGDASNMASLNENTVGEGGFNTTMTYAEVILGQLVATGTDPNEITLEYITGFGAEPQVGTINVVPEPGTLAMLLAGALGVGLIGWRRRPH